MSDKRPPKKLYSGYRSKSFELINRADDVIRPNGKKRPVWNCKCIHCGNERKIESQMIASSSHSDCVCITGEHPRKNVYRGGVTTKYKKEYNSYKHMIARCYNEKECGYENYGGRGIQVSEFWREDFRNFLEDMGQRPQGFVLDRIDANGDYCKENCRWVDRNLSSFNTRKSKNNTSGRTGVYWFERVSKWTAAIVYKNKQIHLGYFESFEEAAKAREEAELKYFGEIKE